jgi:transcriptional regulator with XRE-family HTH domain
MKDDTMGSRLRLAIQRAGFTQAQVAEIVGRDPQTIRNWVADRHNPSPEQLVKVADLLDVDAGWLQTGASGLDSSSVLSELRELRAGQRQLLAELLALRRSIEAEQPRPPGTVPLRIAGVNPQSPEVP